jgi:predicted homoserine dehydrogenase-like protein
MRLKLIEREKEDTPIKVGVIGAGLFASMTINQTTEQYKTRE